MRANTKGPAKVAVLLASGALILAGGLAACGSTPTVTSSPATETPSQSSEAAVAPSSAGQSQSQSQPALGPAAKIAQQIKCTEARAADGGTLATASSVYCTDGQRGYTLTVYGSQNRLNSQFKKLENSVKETGETLSIIIGSNWILRGTEAQQVGSKIEASAAAAGGRVVTFSDQVSDQSSQETSPSATAKASKTP